MAVNTFSSCPEYDLCLVRGDDKYYRLEFTYGDPPVELDITGYTITLTAKRNLAEEDSDALFQTVAELTDPTNGIATIHLTNVMTKQPVATYFYDIQLESPSGDIKTVLRGKLAIVWEVTNG